MVKRSRRKPARRRGARVLSAGRGLVLRALLGLAVLAAGYVAWLDLKVRSEFDGRRWAVSARIYARPLELYPGMRLSAQELEQELLASGYQRSQRAERPGQYVSRGSSFTIRTREFGYWDYSEPARRLELQLRDGRAASLREGDAVLPIARIDPALIGHIFPAHQEDRILVKLPEVPPMLVQGLLAVEDRRFYEHYGLSPRSIARAALANLWAGETVQGGSTLTQQLAKNFFLSHERTLARKLNEAIIALLLELHYEKDDIFEAYLNEVFLGQDQGRAIHGFGLASHYYFGRPLTELRLAESALLVGLVRGASYYNPRRHPERARSRRDLVLAALAGQGAITVAEAAAAAAEPLGVIASPPSARTPHPAFVDLVRRQLRRDYAEDDLRSEGLRIFTTLQPRLQAQAERALHRRAEGLEKQAGLEGGSLQGAVVVTSTTSGEVLALVGDRMPRREGFNRALDARRPVGSVAKPAVYLSALALPERFSLMSGLDDRPLSIRDPDTGVVWEPANYDNVSHGTVALHTALANSYNLATVRLGMAVGINTVTETLQRLGVERTFSGYPSLLLGAISLTPAEVTQMYQTLASGGFQMPLRAIREVSDARGTRLARYGLSVRQTFEAEPVFLLNHALSEVMSVGTGRGVTARLGPNVTVAGKTGTTDDLRDSWFAGFDGAHLAVVWLGKDDNSPIGLTGASGALPVWTDLMESIGVESLVGRTPPRIEWHWSDAEHAGLTDPGCPGARRTPFWGGTLPPYAACPGGALAVGFGSTAIGERRDRR